MYCDLKKKWYSDPNSNPFSFPIHLQLLFLIVVVLFLLAASSGIYIIIYSYFWQHFANWIWWAGCSKCSQNLSNSVKYLDVL